MTEVVVVLWLYCAAVLLYGADLRSRRGDARLEALRTPAHRKGARALAAGLCLLAGWLWARIEPGPAPYFMVLVGLMALGTVVALVGSRAPRLLWTGALAGGALSVLWLLVAGLP